MANLVLLESNELYRVKMEPHPFLTGATFHFVGKDLQNTLFTVKLWKLSTIHTVPGYLYNENLSQY
jgi:hypothetical protein